MKRSYLAWIVVLLFGVLQGCGSHDGSTPLYGFSSSSKGSVSVSITDAPAFGFDHVWITVKDLWFHTNESAEPGQPGWVKFPLSAPVTLDLLALGNGNISVPVLDDVEVPEGDYTQIRVFLARTEADPVQSALDEHLTYNNQVDVTGDTAAYPLRVPGAFRGIRLTGDFTVKKNEKLKLAIDFDAGNDVVQVDHDGNTEYILKPRLAYFDLQNAGAIIGSVTGTNAAGQFVIKAEQLAPNGMTHVVRRITVPVNETAVGETRNFVLFPLAPGPYDVVIRGLNHRTVIVKNVPAVRGTTPQANPTVIPNIAMTPAENPDYVVNASIISPTGAWTEFYQALPGPSEVPYLVRFRHFNPLTGHFAGFPLSSEPIRVGVFTPGSSDPLSLQTVTPQEGNGGYKAMADAPLHNAGDINIVTAGTGTILFNNLVVSQPAASRTVTGSIIVPETFAPAFIDRGVLFASHGGMIVNAIRLESQLATGGTYTISNLPGGTPGHPLPGAFYSIDAFGWSAADAGNKAVAVPRFVDLSTNDATGIDLTMQPLQ